MCKQLEELADFEDSVSIQGNSRSGFEVTIHYWGPEGMTHFHTNGPTLPETVDRAFRRRHQLRSELPTEESK
jgi:hypothetical protein